ncbi:unnamed protein product [Urochloa humidicola]
MVREGVGLESAASGIDGRCEEQCAEERVSARRHSRRRRLGRSGGRVAGAGPGGARAPPRIDGQRRWLVPANLVLVAGRSRGRGSSSSVALGGGDDCSSVRWSGGHGWGSLDVLRAGGQIN